MNSDAQSAPPSYLTPEFWSMVFVHVLSAIALAVPLTVTNRDLTTAQACIPVAALLTSALTSYVYANHRTRRRVLEIAADAARLAHTPAAATATSLAELLDPAAVTKLKAILAAVDANSSPTPSPNALHT